jgi:hypothetical protein
MNKSEAKDVLKRHLHHWEHLLQDGTCNEKEGKETTEALDLAVKALDDNPTGEFKCVTCKYRGGEIISKICRKCSRSWADLYEEDRGNEGI